MKKSLHHLGCAGDNTDIMPLQLRVLNAHSELRLLPTW